MRVGDAVTWLALSGLLVALVGCNQGEQPPTANEAGVADTLGQPEQGSVPAAQTPQVLWAHSCALCHVDGIAGAPRMGNTSEWGPRLAKGRDVLLQHTVEGFNQMPPLGYCMSCERADFVALIDFMTQGIDADVYERLSEPQPEAGL